MQVTNEEKTDVYVVPQCTHLDVGAYNDHGRILAEAGDVFFPDSFGAKYLREADEPAKHAHD